MTKLIIIKFLTYKQKIGLAPKCAKNKMQNLNNIWVKYLKNSIFAQRWSVVRNLYEEVCCQFSHSLFLGSKVLKTVGDCKECYVGMGREWEDGGM